MNSISQQVGVEFCEHMKPVIKIQYISLLLKYITLILRGVFLCMLVYANAGL